MGETSDVCGYKVHPAADVFPLMTGDAYRELVEDMRKNGLLHPIVMVGDRILDGRNRVRACVEVGAELRFTHYEGDDPIGRVVSENLSRRHLNESQRAMIAARVATLRQGGDRGNQHTGGKASIDALAQDEAAAQLNVGRASVQRARTVITSAIPEVVQAVDAGELAVSAAANVAKLPEDEQRGVMQESGGKMRSVRSLARERLAENDEPEPEVSEPPPNESERSRVARETDAKVRSLWESGTTNQAEIARVIGVAGSTVGLSLRRQGLVKQAHPIQSIERRARETADDLVSFMGQPELYRAGSDRNDRDQCIKSLRALASAANKAINWLNKEAIGG